MITVNDKSLCEACFAEVDSDTCGECGFRKRDMRSDNTILSMGSVLEDRYLIGRVIGKGGFGITYLAYDMKLQCRVAIKEYFPYGVAVRDSNATTVSVSSDDSSTTFKEGANKFYEEARLVAGFNGNPNIVSVYDFFYGNDTVYFTMGYLQGITLKKYIADKGILSTSKAVRLANDVCNALMVAHSENVLHRDISPDNIMVCYDGTIKLLDFGAARQVFTDESRSLSVILKQGFAPLEQYQKRGKQGPWTDIYSLGATLYYSLTGDVIDDPMSRLDDDNEFVSNRHGIHEGLWKIIVKATMLKPKERYQDVFELKEDLDNLNIAPETLINVDYRTKTRKSMTRQTDTESVPVSSVIPEKKTLESNIGVTMPAKETAPVGVTMPANEEENDSIGITMPARETADDSIGVTLPVREGTSPVAGMHSSGKKKTGGIIIGAIAGAAVIVAGITAIMASNNKEFLYEEYDDHVVITEYHGDGGNIVIPSEINGKPVTKLGYNTFDSDPDLLSVVIPSSVEEIEDSAFYCCTNLERVYMYDGLEKIGSDAFSLCFALDEVEIPSTVEKIGSYAFFRCESLSELTINEGVETIGSYMFRGCDALEKVELPDSVSVVSMGAFSDCMRLSEVSVPEGVLFDSKVFENSDLVNVVYRINEETDTSAVTDNRLSENTMPIEPTSPAQSSLIPTAGSSPKEQQEQRPPLETTSAVTTAATTTNTKPSAVTTSKPPLTTTIAATKPVIKDTGDELNIYCWNSEIMNILSLYYPDYKDVDSTSGYIGDVRVNFIMNYDNYSDSLEEILNQRNSSDAVDIFLIEETYMERILSGSYASSLEELGISDSDTQHMYQYTKDLATYNGELMAAAWEVCPGGFAYRRSIAKDVLGTDDPEKVQDYLDSWAKFGRVAEKMGNNDYYMVSNTREMGYAFFYGESNQFVNGKEIALNDSMRDWLGLSKYFYDNNYCTGSDTWSLDWGNEQSADGKVFGFFYSTWGLNYTLPSYSGGTSDGDWGLVAGPGNYVWGGSYLAVSKNSDNKDLAADIIRALCCDSSVMTEMLDGKIYPNNSKVLENEAKKNNKDKFFGGQNTYAVLADIAKNCSAKGGIKSWNYPMLFDFTYFSCFEKYFKGDYTYNEIMQEYYNIMQELYPGLTAPSKIPKEP